MLKINLLPSLKREQRASAPSSAETGKLILILGGVVLIGAVAGLFLYHGSQTKTLDDVRTANGLADGRVRSIRSRIADHDRVRHDLAEIQAREEAIGHLESARTGPTSMLIELSHLLAPGGRPSIDPVLLDHIQRDNPTLMFNSTWDPHRLWLRRFEEENREVEIEGDGRTPDDVGEFMRRMMLSQYFEQVRLERSEGAQDEVTKISVQRFKVVARVRY